MLLHKSVEFDSRVRREARRSPRRVTRSPWSSSIPARAASSTASRACPPSPPPWVRRALPFQLYRASSSRAFLRGCCGCGPDVVHAHDAAMLLPGLLGARLTGAKLVYDSHELATGVPYRDGALGARSCAGSSGSASRGRTRSSR